MEALSNIQRIIDKNSNNIPEGDYLELCNSTKDIFMDKTTINHRIFSRHDNFPHQFDNFTGNTRYYFENIFSEINKDIEWNVLNATRKELLKQVSKCREVKRVTKKIKCQVVHSYNIIHNLRLEENTPECFRKNYNRDEPFDEFFKELCQVYIDMLNIQNKNTSDTIKKKIHSIEDYMELI